MIYTGRFSEVKKYEQAGFIPVSIAGYAPDYYKGIEFKTLAPKYSWWKQWHDHHLSDDWYKERYQETVLDRLNPKIIANRLKSFGDNVVLLCYEKTGEFCHRQLVADWLRTAGVPVCEYSATLCRDLFEKLKASHE